MTAFWTFILTITTERRKSTVLVDVIIIAFRLKNTSVTYIWVLLRKRKLCIQVFPRIPLSLYNFFCLFSQLILTILCMSRRGCGRKGSGRWFTEHLYAVETMFECQLLQDLHEPSFFSTQVHLKTLSVISKWPSKWPSGQMSNNTCHSKNLNQSLFVKGSLNQMTIKETQIPGTR